MAKAKLTVVKPAQRTASVPEHLGAAGRELWASIQASYAIADPGGLALLQQAAEAADRIASVRRQIDEQGELLVIKGIPRVNPLCAVERDQRAALVRCLRNLNLDIEPLRDGPGRPEGLRWAGKEKW
jgi:nucleotide-binding universal stress UspA family protein